MKAKLLILFLIIFSSFAVSAQTQTPETKQTETGIVFLSRPRADYSDKARSRGFSAQVVLRVTFLANGEIGDIADETTKKKEKIAKYGLLDEAVKAAKKIKFVPATVNGQPVTVSKLIAYNFTTF